MKVVQVLPALDSGGVEKGTLEIARALVRAGHDSLVISAGGRLVQTLLDEGSRHISWDLGKKSPLTLRHLYSVRRWLEQEQPDIIHLRSRMPAWIVWLAWRGLPVHARPHIVTTVHGLYSVSRYSAIMCQGERVIAVSDTVRQYILQHYPATPEDRIQVIYRGIDPHDFPYGYQPPEVWQAQWQQQYPHLAGKILLTLPGRLTRLKGHHLFIDLIRELHRRNPAIHGLIVGGEDPKRQRYAKEIFQRLQQEGMSDMITCTGHRTDMRDIFATSSLVLSLSSKPESFGRTVLEALSLGVPVMGLAHGGVGEILSQLYPSGKIVPDCSLNTLIVQIEQQLAAPRPVPTHHSFTLSALCGQTLDLYTSLINANAEAS